MPASALVINVEPAEMRIALIEDGIITEFLVERTKSRSIVGNIYNGRVGRVMRGMQASFVDIGLDRHAFLQVGDTIRSEDFDMLSLSDAGDNASGTRRVSKSTPIGKVLKAGQSVVVQISRTPIGRKGARVTSHVSIPGRRLVFLPTLDQIGVSRRIQEDKERRRLRAIVDNLRSNGGFIIRTVAEGASVDDLASDVEYLTKLWADILASRQYKPAPFLLYEDLDLPLRVARDLFSGSVEQFVVDDATTYERLLDFAHKFFPDRAKRIMLYEGDEPIFDAFGIEEEIQRALARVIPLPSGGSLVIDHAEALTAIDVNTGRYAGGRDLEDTITRTNLEAVKEVAYQIRLRNIGGLIVVDFIDMDRPANREKVNRVLQEALKDDRAQTTAVRISELGLVEMTRKGAQESLGRQLFESCFYCDGTGQLKSRTTISCDLLRELRRRLLELRSARVSVECHPQVAEVLLEEHKEAIASIEKRFAKKVEIRSREDFHLERFDIKGGRRHGAKAT